MKYGRYKNQVGKFDGDICTLTDGTETPDADYAGSSVLGDGFVYLVDIMGNDNSIVQAARVSYGAGTKTVREDEGLIRYLMRNQHTTPFEMVETKWHIKMPIFVARQWIRHRTASVNEYSMRYSEALEGYYSPEVWRGQSSTNKQASESVIEYAPLLYDCMGTGVAERAAIEEYQNRLNSGVSRELARTCLPLSTWTEMYWKIDLKNLLHFLNLRLHSHAQKEIRVYAEVMRNVLLQYVPLTMSAFKDYMQDSVMFSGADIDYLKGIDDRLSEREKRELKEKMNVLSTKLD